MNRLRDVIKVDPALSLDLKIYLTLEVIPYSHCLAGFRGATMQIWRGKRMVSNNLLCFEHPMLRVDFSYLRKRTPYLRQLVRHDRPARLVLGTSVPYQYFTVLKSRPSE